MNPDERATLGKLAHELDGVIADVMHGMGFNVTCLETVKRVRDALHGVRSNDTALQSARGKAIGECAAIAKAHKGAATRERIARGQTLRYATDETRRSIVDEERGEDIAAKVIASKIRDLLLPLSESQQPRSGDK